MRVLKSPNFEVITILNETSDVPLDLGHHAYEFEYPGESGQKLRVAPMPSYSGYLNILNGSVRIGNGAGKRNHAELEIQHFDAEPFPIPANWSNTVFKKLRAKYLWLFFYQLKKGALKYIINGGTYGLTVRASFRAMKYDDVS